MLRSITNNNSKSFAILNDLSESIAKAAALVQIALNVDFLSYTHHVHYDYLWALSDFIEQARQLCEQLEEIK